MADYLSRHPAQCDESTIKSEEMCKDWFTLNIVKEFTIGLEQAVFAKRNQPTKSRKTETRIDSGEWVWWKFQVVIKLLIV